MVAGELGPPFPAENMYGTLRKSVPYRNVVREVSGAIPAFDCVVRSGSVRIRQ